MTEESPLVFKFNTKRKPRMNKAGKMVIPMIDENGEECNWIMSLDDVYRMFQIVKAHRAFEELEVILEDKSSS